MTTGPEQSVRRAGPNCPPTRTFPCPLARRDLRVGCRADPAQAGGRSQLPTHTHPSGGYRHQVSRPARKGPPMLPASWQPTRPISVRCSRESMSISPHETIARKFLTGHNMRLEMLKSGARRSFDQGSELGHLILGLRIRRLGVRVPSGAQHQMAPGLRKRGSGAFQDSSIVDSRCSWGARLFRNCLCRDCRRRAGARRSIWILAEIAGRSKRLTCTLPASDSCPRWAC